MRCAQHRYNWLSDHLRDLDSSPWVQPVAIYQNTCVAARCVLRCALLNYFSATVQVPVPGVFHRISARGVIHDVWGCGWPCAFMRRSDSGPRVSPLGVTARILHALNVTLALSWCDSKTEIAAQNVAKLRAAAGGGGKRVAGRQNHTRTFVRFRPERLRQMSLA
jgi:hypothetical protein